VATIWLKMMDGAAILQRQKPESNVKIFKQEKKIWQVVQKQIASLLSMKISK